MITCKTCNKNILPHHSKFLCCNCNHFYHTRCVYTDCDQSQNWICFKCTGDIFPFNHYVEDDEFKFALFTFEHSYEYNQLLDLKLNPFNLDENIRGNGVNDSGYVLDSGNLNSCSYIFDCDQLPASTDDDFSILHINPRSLNKNFDGIHAFLSSFKHIFSIITLSETWFNEDGSNLIDIENYTLLSAPRRHGRRSGGSAIYVHNSVSYRIRDDLKLNTEHHENTDHSESIFVELIFSKSKNIVIGNIYRAHRTDTDSFITDLSHCLSKITDENKNCYVSGDFNFDLLQYNNINVINNFLNTFYNNFMYPLIDRPTRITSSSATLH